MKRMQCAYKIYDIAALLSAQPVTFQFPLVKSVYIYVFVPKYNNKKGTSPNKTVLVLLKPPVEVLCIIRDISTSIFPLLEGYLKNLHNLLVPWLELCGKFQL